MNIGRTIPLVCPSCGWKYDCQLGEPWPACWMCGKEKVVPPWWNPDTGTVAKDAIPPEDEGVS